MQGEKIEAWFLSPASKEYFSVESTGFLSVSKCTKKVYPLVKETAEYSFCFFFISEAIEIAVSSSKFQCLYSIILLL